MRIVSLHFCLLFSLCTLSGQTSLEEINLKKGAYKVGFKHYTIIDSTRNYRIHNEFNNRIINRPIPVSLWYPAQLDHKQSKPLEVLDYLEILKEEEEWEHLPNEFLLDWFPHLWNTPQNKAHLSEKVTAFSKADFLSGQFPIIIYAPSYQASSIENFALFEFLASNGFVIMSSPSRGTHTRWLEGGTAKDMETQSRDIAILLKEIHQYKNVDFNNIALMGFSFGGLANALTAMKNNNIKAIVSLDGTERYRYALLQESLYFDLDKFNIPYIHFAQKDIPNEVMVSDKIPAELNYKFQLYDSLRYSNAQSYKFHHLTHAYFSTYGVLFANRDKRQDKSDAEIMESFKVLSVYTLQFLNATLKKDEQAIKFIKNDPETNGFPKNLVSRKIRKPFAEPFDYKNFNDLALQQDYQDLVSLYKRILAKHRHLHLEEGMLNMLGLRLSFNRKTTEQGVNVFLLALHIYPNSANLYDSLAEAYLYNKDFENAKINFRKSLELNPQNQNAINRLKQLRE